ncbi:hypothetical protein COO60DRAFT_1458304 [Scenedesmus sp. NREL 46B-D3]|nr:hypothetical protein COO60DRAFT_1458304 [Scenedesmus sp. NREL 46B-D3]
MYPDTAATHALCLCWLAHLSLRVRLERTPSCATADAPCSHLDLAKVQAGSGLSGFITAGLLHSGLAATWLYSSALTDSGRWLEIGWGPMELSATYVITSLCASFAHMVAGGTMVCVAGAGAVMGVYTTWYILALQHLSRDVPTGRLGVNVGVLLLLSLGLGAVQPAIGAASVVGGVLGGALAVKLAVPVAAAMRWGVSVPVLLLLFVLRMGVDALKLALLALVPLFAAAVQGVIGVVQAVRKV